MSMADQNKPAQTASQSVAGQGGIGGSDNPQNRNLSPSPGGDGVQSAASERTAHGADRGVDQPGQQRINAAERRERGENTKQGDKVGERASLIQSPGEVLPYEAAAAALDAAEQKRFSDAEKARDEEFKDLPQATIDEINAGRNALKRHDRAAATTNPVDATEADAAKKA
jgi:hypothetical protein